MCLPRVRLHIPGLWAANTVQRLVAYRDSAVQPPSSSEKSNMKTRRTTIETHVPCKITILEVKPSCVWARGVSDPYKFEALVYCTGSKYGIDNGRISKFAVWIDDEKRGKHWLANYDRGWDIYPDEECQAPVSYFIGLLEAMPGPEELKISQTFELD